VAAHVGEHQEARAAFLRLQPQIVDADVVVRIDLDQQRHAAGVVDRARHRGQGVGVGEHRLAGTQARGAQRDVEGIAAGGAGQAVLGALIGGEFRFEGGRLGDLAGGHVVAMEAARTQDLDRPCDRRFGDRLLLGEGLGEARHRRLGLTGPVAAHRLRSPCPRRRTVGGSFELRHRGRLAKTGLIRAGGRWSGRRSARSQPRQRRGVR
jgi:hypothetical protein